MSRAISGIAAAVFMCVGASAQTPPDPRIDQLTKETAQLRKALADQAARIAELERAVKNLQAVAAPLPTRIPSEVPQWHHAANWTQVKTGMSEAQVVQILGSPTSVDTSIDTRVLLYQPDAKSTSQLKGSVTLTGDRVVAMVPPAF